MKAQIKAASGSADAAVRSRPRAEVRNPGAGGDSRRARPAPAEGPGAQDFALAMRRVEAECYDSF